MNMNGPEKDSVYRWRKKNSVPFKEGMNIANFENAAGIIQDIMRKKGVPSVPWFCAEDETGIQKAVTYHQETDLLIGFCGRKSEKDHQCLAEFQLPIGDNETSYNLMVNAFREYSTGTLARVLILNPMHASLPRLVIGLFPTCNRFTHADVKRQWDVVEDLFEKSMAEKVGPLVGHSSDGDTRRRKLEAQSMLSCNGIRFNPIGREKGFLFSSRKVEKEDGSYFIKDVGDQDWIHNGKKYICHLDHVSRSLQLGDGMMVLMNHVELLVEQIDVFKHKLTKEHVRRGRDRQNWRIAQQLAFKCVRDSFSDLISGNIEGYPPDNTLTGTKVFLHVIWYYIEIFASPVLPLKDRITYASLVVHFLAVWRNFVVWEEKLSLKSNFISNQCYIDILLSCHSAVIMICFFRDAYAHLPFPIHRMGSDCCEEFFSKNTQYIGNHPVYPFGNMLRNVTYMNRLMQIEADKGGPIFSRAHAKQETVWIKQYKQEEIKDEKDILTDYPANGEEKNLWNEGIKMAHGLLTEVGIHRTRYDGYEYDGEEGPYDWYDSPFTSGDHPTLFAKLSHEDVVVLDNDDAEDSEAADNDDEEDPEAVDNDIDFQFDATPEERTETQNRLEETIDSIEEIPKKYSPTVNVPGHGRQYKSTLVKLLNENTSLSKDRLTRVRQKPMQSETETVIDTSNHIILFSDYAVVVSDQQNLFNIVRVHRMTYLGKKRVEYKNPVKLSDDATIKNLEISCSLYRKTGINIYVRDDKSQMQPMNAGKILCHVNLQYDASKCAFILPNAEMEVINEHCNKTNNEPTKEVASKKKKQNTGNSNQHAYFDGVFTETIEHVASSSSSSGTRQSTRKRTIRHYIN